MFNDLAKKVFEQNKQVGWWNDLETGQPLYDDQGNINRNIPELLCLIHSEISEAMEGYRKDLQDNHLPHRKMFEVELADAIIRIADMSGAMKLDLDGTIAEKLSYNKQRADHKLVNRIKNDGKKF